MLLLTSQIMRNDNRPKGKRPTNKKLGYIWGGGGI